MGTFHVSIAIGDPQGQRWERVEALVDTGASYTTLPASLLRRLGVRPTERRRFRLADERTTDRDIGTTQVRIDGRTYPTIVVFGLDNTFILGAVTLEEFALAVDPLGQRLISVEGLLM